VEGHDTGGQLTLMLVVGSASTLAYVVLGLPNALLLGIFAGVVESVPIIGPAIGAFPPLITAFVTGGPELALLVPGVYVVIQVVEGQIFVRAVWLAQLASRPTVIRANLPCRRPRPAWPCARATRNTTRHASRRARLPA